MGQGAPPAGPPSPGWRAHCAGPLGPNNEVRQVDLILAWWAKSVHSVFVLFQQSVFKPAMFLCSP